MHTANSKAGAWRPGGIMQCPGMPIPAASIQPSSRGLASCQAAPHKPHHRCMQHHLCVYQRSMQVCSATLLVTLMPSIVIDRILN